MLQKEADELEDSWMQIGDDCGEWDPMPCYMLPDATSTCSRCSPWIKISLHGESSKLPGYSMLRGPAHPGLVKGCGVWKAPLAAKWVTDSTTWKSDGMWVTKGRRIFSDLRPGDIAHFAPIINGTPSSTRTAFLPALKHIKQLLPFRATTPGLQQPCTAWTRV